jgi:hypothetical protein
MHKYWLSIILLSCIGPACNKGTGVLPANSVLKLQLANNGIPTPNMSIPADNYSYAQIMAIIDSTILDTTTTINFTTDNGSFSTGGTSYAAKVDIHGNAYAYLKSKVVVTAHVQATVGANYTQNLTIPFTTSYPDTMYINLPDSASNDLANRVSFSATLYKYLGSISPGLSVNFSARDTLGTPLGSFTHVLPSDTTGTVNAQFWLDNSSYTGFVYFNAYLLNGGKDTIRTSSKMLITH